MLTILVNGTAARQRTKYFRRLDHKQWVVWDTTIRQRVYGPASHRSCIKFISITQKSVELALTIFRRPHAEVSID